MARLLDYDPLTGSTQWFHWNNDGTFAIEYQQDVSRIIELNKRTAIESDAKKQMSNDWVKYASIPAILVQKWKNELGVDVTKRENRKKMFQLINSPEYRDIKTTTIFHEPPN